LIGLIQSAFDREFPPKVLVVGGHGNRSGPDSGLTETEAVHATLIVTEVIVSRLGGGRTAPVSGEPVARVRAGNRNRAPGLSVVVLSGDPASENGNTMR
jgi:hypothetical protein